ncbi:ubiquitin-conjugating enzyme E2Q-like protein 1 [Centruroides sculpturatus]|uniref:ubiquitin-conjugating enzyme E2Q-like protein 1 n=1 Tax=Centruroides sculpturatus TaxID=218467 RepID=UPI000C6E942C|nr:ubiquitin-conjugating enzyme E2Q-like protein 1 [Centruroides sculpturatus]XP_023241181.1 ubiquitin-conjugating enzyme E2Q-like protein 1 [Centruroides sculpturatus]XP_023241182.1 ubiquitin-conjugating enzyme E2Q-like protein 1 [Centruroides sculpturatus]
MASAFRKLFKPSGEGSGGRKNAGESNSPGHQSAALRFFGHCSSPRSGRRDAKVGPAETPSPGKGGASGGVALKSKSKSGQKCKETEQNGQTVRTRRLMKEYREICRNVHSVERPPFTVELVEDNLFEWNIMLYQLDPESEFYRDMQEMGITYILLNLTFPENFPFSPPFMRVISPHIEKGYVMEGGAICMELLTPRGWASAYTVEAIIMQFAASLIKGQGRISRKCKTGKEFNRKLAEASFRSLVKTHEKYGWVTPPLADG